MSDSKQVTSGGTGILGLLGVVFVTLKLCGVIAWPWLWVTAPFWGGFALVLVVAVGFLMVCLIGGLLSGFMKFMEKSESK